MQIALSRQTAMRRLGLLLILALLACARQDPVVLEPVQDSKFKPGQQWAYENRPSDSGSTLTVLRVEREPRTGTIVHIRIEGVNVKNPHVPGGVSHQIGHMPFAEAALEKSVTRLLRDNVSVRPDDPGYLEWRRAFEANQGGIFTISVSEGIEFVAQTLK